MLPKQVPRQRVARYLRGFWGILCIRILNLDYIDFPLDTSPFIPTIYPLVVSHFTTSPTSTSRCSPVKSLVGRLQLYTFHER